jgi:hypothetical protein
MRLFTMASSKWSRSADPQSDYMPCEPAPTQDKINYPHEPIDLRNRELDLEKAERTPRDQPWRNRLTLCTVGLACLFVLTLVTLGAVGFYFDMIRPGGSKAHED